MAKVRALTGGAVDRATGLQAQGRIESVGGRYRLRLWVREDGTLRERTIESDTCTNLAGAAAVTLVLLFGMEIRDGEATTLAPAPDSRAPEASTGVEGLRAPSGPQVPVAAPPREVTPPTLGGPQARVQEPNVGSGWALLLRAPALAVNHGPLPQMELRGGLGVGWRTAPFRFLLNAQLSRSQEVNAEVLGENVGVSARRGTVTLEFSRGFHRGSFEFAPLAGVGLEYLRATGFGEGVSARPRQAIWPAPFVGAAGYWYARKWLAFFVQAQAVLELSRPRLELEGLGEVSRLRPFALGLSVGTEWLL